MLCAGYIPHESLEDGSSITPHFQESISYGTLIDPHGYVPPNHELHNVYLELLSGKQAASPYDMVNLLRPAISTAYSRINTGQEYKWATSKRLFTLKALREFQWFLIIGNAVGLQVPAIVPFDLLNGLRDQLVCPPVSKSSTEQSWTEPKKGEQPDISYIMAGAQSVQEPEVKQRKFRERQLPQATPEVRGYHTTEEVAGLTNLLPATLNKYARAGTTVEGFTPFKRQGGKAWQWRNDRQHAEYDASANTDKPKHRSK